MRSILETKAKLLDQVRAHLQRDLAVLEAAARAAAETATHEESKPENQYDTRALEASYLAGAQNARLLETRAGLATIVATQPQVFEPTATVALTALVQLDLDRATLWYFVTSVGGGYRLSLDAESVLTVTPQSPLGQAVIGRRVGDEVVVGRGEAEKVYEILSIS